LGVSYSYLSKLENDEVMPSEDFVNRAATYFKCDRDRLLLSAGKIPPEVLKILQQHPEDAIELLKSKFGSR
jgi:transcriptional regulator with XRE-family HTH domain